MTTSKTAEEIAHGIVYMHHSHSKIKDLPCLENDIKEALDQKDAEKASLQSKLSLAVEALEFYSTRENLINGFNVASGSWFVKEEYFLIAQETLAKVKEKV